MAETRMSELTPLPEPNFSGMGDREAIGAEFLHHFVKLGGLKPDDNVLDVGCGDGRMAVQLTRFLSDKGRYEGFDIVKRAVDWCSDNISTQFGNFTFQVADIYNKVYHPSGRFQADEFTFPYEDESFDFVFLTSVFTHLLPQGMENYFSEVSRVMKTGGRCFITYFLLDDESSELIKAGRTRHVCFPHKFDEKCYVMDLEKPEMSVCYGLDYISTLYRENGLEVDGPIHFGSWCERSGELKSFQDIIVARKLSHNSQRYRTLRQRRYTRLLRPSSILQQGLSLSWQLLPSSVKSIVRRRLSK